jgi:SAM-dependent methyltransferase
MPRYEPFNWYDDPEYYDLIFGADTKLEADFIEAVALRLSGRRCRRVLEPACGTGRLVVELARRGHDVTGFDLSDASLRFARRRLAAARRRARLSRAALQRFSFPRRFDLAHCLVSTFKYLLDEASARHHLRCVARALDKGGFYLLGIHLSEYGERGLTRERWVARRGEMEVVCNIQVWPPDRRKRTERVRSRLVVRRGGATRHLETNWLFRSYGVRQMRSLLKSVPQFEHVATYGFDYLVDAPFSFDGNRLDNVLVLRKK